MFEPDLFCFLNEQHRLRPGQWDRPELSLLWRYNLHYFDDLNASNAASRSVWHRDLMLQWVRENPPASGTGWEPYPTSLRIINWIKWGLGGHSLPRECIQNLSIQVRWLTKRIEYHLLGNHLFSNAKALVFAGSFFTGREAKSWFDLGMNILSEQIPEQVLADGGHFERSTMYHALAFEDMLDLVNLARSFPEVFSTWRDVTSEWQSIALQMGTWLSVMTHPDGEISFFNDSTLGIAPEPAALFEYSSRLGIPIVTSENEGITELRESGYLKVKIGSAGLFVDVAPVGPEYLPAHAHADTLSFELSLFENRVFVNSGISCYGESKERTRQRGTAAHNSVIIEGQDSSEVWGGFRVARRAYPQIQKLDHSEGMVKIRASHDGYRRLKNKNMHVRSWEMNAGGVVVEDEIVGAFADAEARFHLHPDVVIGSIPPDHGCIRLRLPTGHEIEFQVDGGCLEAIDSTWHPGFGQSVENVCIVVTFRQNKISTRCSWSNQ